jgi:nitrite reductase (NADH) large subunit
VRTADRLERTATWLNKLEGGVDYVRRVVVDDALGICAELEAEMERHVEAYECEWKATIDDPARASRFRTFLNDGPDNTSTDEVAEPGQWVDVCALDALVPGRGECVLVGEDQVALFRLPDETLYALSNYDPFSRTNVLSRGIVGSKDGVTKVASPVYKQGFDLRTGQCLDDPAVSIMTFAVRATDGRVEVAVP